MGSDSVTQEWLGSLPSPAIDGSTATYHNVYPGVDLVLRAQVDGYEESWVINSRPDTPLSLDVPLSLKGLRAVDQPNGGVALVDAQGSVKATSDPATMWDSTIDPSTGEPANTEQLPTTVTKTSSGSYVLEVTPDQAFLDSATYPVTIDPTSSISVTTDTYIDNSHPTGEFQENTLLKSGDDGIDNQQLQRALLSFPTSGLSGATIQSATLNLYETWSGACSGTKVDVYNVNSSWTGGVTWNTQPALGSLYASGNTSVGFGSACPAAWVAFSSGGTGSNTLTSLVQGWAAGTIANHGVEVRADNESSTAAYKRFNSADYGANAPSLAVTYDFPPSTPTNLSPSSGTTQTVAPVSLGATFSDPDGGSGHVDYTVKDSSGDVVASGAGATVSSGSASAYSIPLGALTDGATYTWTAVGDDGTLTSVTSAPMTFTLDTTPGLAGFGPEDGSVIDEASPSFLGTISDPNGGSGWVDFQVMDQTCTQVIASGDGSSATDGMDSVWALPAPVTLPIGYTYGLEARTADGTGSLSPWSPCQTFEDVPALTVASPAAGTVATVLTPTLSVVVGSDSATTVTPTFTVYNEADNSQVASGEGTTAAAGGTSTWSVPTGVLTASGRYYWSVSAPNAISTVATSYYPVTSGAQIVVTAPLLNDQVGGAVTLAASPAGFDSGSVTSISFYVDGNLAGTAAAAPWQIDFSPTGTGGTHVVTAIATGTVNGAPATATAPGVGVSYADADVETTTPGAIASPPDSDPSDPPTPYSDTPPAGDVNQPLAAGITVSKTHIVSYAEKYALSPNPAFITYSNDCTNFVSQALYAGGWTFTNGGGSSNTWFYNVHGNVHLPINSPSWSVVSNFYSFATGSGRAVHDTTSIWDAVPGDVILVDWNGGSSPVDHAMVVTERTYGTGGNIYLTYHTTNRKNFPFEPPTSSTPWDKSLMGIIHHHGWQPKFWLLYVKPDY